MKIVVDYGHGGQDSGALGNGVTEKDINRKIGERVVYHLKRHGQTVITTRNNDDTVSLDERVNIINRNSCDIGISIHCNSARVNTARGLETYTWGNGSRELQLAKCVHNSIKKDNLYHIDRGLKQEQFRVLSPQIPLCLVELGFINNEQDKNLLLDNIEKFAVAITRGLLAYYEISFKVDGKEPTYRGLADGVQIFDKTLSKWIPSMIETQLKKGISKIVIEKC